MTQTLRARVALGAVLLLFILSALAFISRPGIEADEALVANPAAYSFHHIPLMEMSYLGALKKWFYLAVFAFAKPGPVSLRVPTILFGAGGLWLFFVLLDRTVGRAAAWIGTLLLATDSMYVILEAIDYGPNALHFVLKLGAMVLLVRFHREGSAWTLAAGFFLLGLGLWDKAIFAWVLFGVGLATLLVFPKEVWRSLTIRSLGIAAASFILGALPLVIYNFARPLDTFRSNVHLNREPVQQKVILLERTLSGFALFGFFVHLPPRLWGAITPWRNIPLAISDAKHDPTRNLTIPALCLACLGLFARASRKAVLFGLLACAGTWLPMLLTAGAGGAAHHVIVIFPFQFLSISAALAAIPRRFVAATATIFLCAVNLAVTREYYWLLVHEGPEIRWTDAIYPLERQLERLRSPDIYAADWGFYQSLVLLSDSSIPLHEIDWSDADSLRKIVSDPRAAFVSHTAEFAYVPQERAALEDTASGAGYEEVPMEIIYDRNGRPTFEVFRFRKIPL